MVIILGTIKLESAADFDKIEDVLVRRAERSKADQGNIEYAFSRGIEDPAEIRLTEIWESEESLNTHLQLPDDEFNAMLEATNIASAIVTLYTSTDERVLMKR